MSRTGVGESGGLTGELLLFLLGALVGEVGFELGDGLVAACVGLLLEVGFRHGMDGAVGQLDVNNSGDEGAVLPYRIADDDGFGRIRFR